MGAFSAISNAIGGFERWVTGANGAADATGTFTISVEENLRRVKEANQQYADAEAAEKAWIATQNVMTESFTPLQLKLNDLGAAVAIAADKTGDYKASLTILNQTRQESVDLYDKEIARLERDLSDLHAVNGANAESSQVYKDVQTQLEGVTRAKEGFIGSIDQDIAKIKSIPEVIQSELVGKAQADLQAFKDCATGKFAGITAIGTDQMDTLVSDVNDLISKGLVGQAQDAIKAFQDCSTNKAADMADSIQKSLEDMVKNGIDTVADMNKYATLTSWLETLRIQADQASELLKTIELPPALTSGGFGYGGAMSKVTPLAEGGIVTQPTLALIGEHGPEAVTPLGAGANGISITGPLVVIEGSCDKATANYAIREIEKMLANVIVEPSSANAASTHKRIRLGSTVQ
jgi:hypothetical protein